MNIAILGFGTVGSGVGSVITANAERITRNAGQEIRVKYILDLHDFPDSPYKEVLIKDFSVIENDPEVKVVVETIGGVGVAYDFTKRCLARGKSVVTSNKELVARHGCELLRLAEINNANYLFEASVGGGIPIIRPISQCLAANEINEIFGILNGTTNYILTQMIKNGLSFNTALLSAQEKGYAEANPEADLEGHDACRKICILSSLSFGRHIYPEQVPTEGITGVGLEDVNYAKSIGYKIKLLGRAVRCGDKVAAYVAPHLIGHERLLADIEDVFNGIVIRGNAIGDVMFYGAGAGALPTASAVVADVIDASKHLNARKQLFWDEGGPEAVSDPRLLESRWYIRCGWTEAAAEKAFGVITAIRPEHENIGEIAFITESMSEMDMREKLRGAEARSAFRILD